MRAGSWELGLEEVEQQAHNEEWLVEESGSHTHLYFYFFEKNHLGDQEIMRNERNAKEKTSGTRNTEISEADSRHREQ